ncbi:SHOCT domain-containing protein [Caldimonas sp. KR1-144]|uniref:SHOCT domain-containing protein n=1 Tax=Caldimonas sp. KR1-144 TaxID=3400911 RepID=UPI003BFF52B8
MTPKLRQCAPRLALGLALMAAAGGAALAQTAPGTTSRGQPVRVMKDSAADRVVRVTFERELSFVRIEQRERGAPPNEHPVAIDAEALRALLARVQLPSQKEALWNAKELEEIAAPLAATLAEATPEQDVSFATSGQHGMLGPLAPKLSTTARVFRRDGQLQVIVGIVRRDVGSAFRGSGVLAPLEIGKRAGAVEAGFKLGVAPEAGSLKRDDWVALRMDAPMAATPARAAAPAAPAVPAAPAGSWGAPAAGAAAAPAPTPPAADADAIARGVGERLKALQKLRDGGLITEQEYQEKRREILKAL